VRFHADMFSRHVPRKLYKCRTFNVFCLRLLTHAEVRYSDLRSFNDLLDCDPTFEVDIDRSALEHLCYAFLRRTQSEDKAKAEINNYRYLSSEYGDFKTGPEVEDYLKRMLGPASPITVIMESGGKSRRSCRIVPEARLIRSMCGD